mgnify:CR=1 FL=1
MKYFLLAITLIIFLSCESPQKESTNALTEEIISVVYMSANNKSKSQIDDFSDYYQKQMKALEPDVLSWRFFKSGSEKITLIERYKNEGAILNHIKNVSPQGVMEEDFVKFMDHFVVDSLTYYGDLTDSTSGFENINLLDNPAGNVATTLTFGAYSAGTGKNITIDASTLDAADSFLAALRARAAFALMQGKQRAREPTFAYIPSATPAILS